MMIPAQGNRVYAIEDASTENCGVNKMAADVETSKEQRCYKLNKIQSMKKKLMASELEAFQMEETNGGVKIRMNAGIYELFRYSASIYLQQCDDKISCKKTDASDKSGNVVETRYKVCTRKSAGHYTLNMYHTTTSCLVNGRNTATFLDTDLSNIFILIEQKVSNENCSINDFNAEIRNMILGYLNCESSESDPKQHAEQLQIRYSDPDNVTPKPSLSDVSCQTDGFTISNAPEQKQQSTQTSVDVFSVITNIHSEISELKQTLVDHIVFTSNKFSQICDEMVHIKNQLSVHQSITDRTLEEINDKQTDFKFDVQRAHDNIQKRLQGIFDSLKTLHAKSNMTTPQSGQTEKVDSQTHNYQNGSQSTPYRSLQRPNFSSNHGNHPSNPSPQSVSRSRSNKTLIIGDSIIKGIQPQGLDEMVDRRTCPGAIIPDIGSQVNLLDMSLYSNVIVYVGGNDVSSGKHPSASRRELYRLTRHIQRQQCRVFLCTISPRQDADVSEYNNTVREVCEDTGADLIDTCQLFVYGDGSMVSHYFMKDAIHLSRYGSQTLVKTINHKIPIIKRKERSHNGEGHVRSLPRQHDFTEQTPKTTRRVIGSQSHDYFPFSSRQQLHNQTRFGNPRVNSA